MNWFKFQSTNATKLITNNHFFWHNNTNKDDRNRHSTIQAIAWENISLPKCEGGLGIKKPEDANASFVVKQDWKFLHNQTISSSN